MSRMLDTLIKKRASKQHLVANANLNVAIGCVAENSPKYLTQALRLLQSMRWFGGAWANVDFHVCLVEQDNREYRRKFNSYGAHVHVVPRFSAVHPPSNKLRFLELPQLAQADRVVLLDCDTIVVQDPYRYLIGADFLAKIADAPTVPHAVFAQLFDAYGIPLPEQKYKCSVHHEPVIPYFNAGVLSFSRKAMLTLVPAWLEANAFLIDQIHLMGDFKNFCEQTSLSLAFQQCDIEYRELSNESNFPAHFSAEKTLQKIDPVIIHYHWLVDNNGYLLPSSYPAVDKRLQKFNKRLRETNAASYLNNQEFWNNRYSFNKELGSGLGSRGTVRAYKQRLIGGIAAELQPASILDVGCGDMAVGEILSETGYTGIDISEVVIDANIAQYPNRKFIRGDFIGLKILPAELTVSLDVLIHLPDSYYYEQFVQKLVTHTLRAGIVAGYEAPPRSASDITFYHEPLSATLKSAGAQNIEPIGGYRQVTIFRFGPVVIEKEVNDSHATHDLRKPVFIVGTMRSGTTLLAELLDLSPHVRHCPFELKDIWSRESRVPMASPKTGDHYCPSQLATDASPQQAARLAKAFTERAKQCSGKSKNSVFLNKNPHLCNKLPWVQALFPDARFIWIHRHLLQVVVSLVRLFEDVRRRQEVVHIWPKQESPNHCRCWEVYRYDQIPDGIPTDRVFPGGNLIWLAEYWLENNCAIKKFSSSSPYSVFQVAEELLLARPLETITGCLAYLELPMLDEDIELPRMEKERNQTWRAMINAHDRTALSTFVDDHSDAINEIFDDSDRARLYLDWLKS